MKETQRTRVSISVSISVSLGKAGSVVASDTALNSHRENGIISCTWEEKCAHIICAGLAEKLEFP